MPVHWIQPVNNGTAVKAVIHEDFWNYTYASDPVTVQAIAVCATTPAGWWIEVVGTQPLQTNPQQLLAWCAHGAVLGGGLTMFQGSLPGAFRVTGFYPEESGGAYLAVEAGSPLPFPEGAHPAWALGSWAICADV